MKKRLPILFVFFGVFLLGGIIWLNSNFKETPKVIDSDGDGVPDVIDLCDTIPSNTSNGCPEKGPTLNTDLDKDGVFSDFQRDASKIDPDDNNACIPDTLCEICDADHDGLNLKEERAKGTLNNKKDTDQDGVDDPVDRCPTKPGMAESDGCVLTINALFNEQGNKVSWNPEMVKYVRRVRIVITNMSGEVHNSVDVTRLSELDLGGQELKKSKRYNIDLIIEFKSPEKVKVLGSNRLTVRI